MIKDRTDEAYKVFKRIAASNKRTNLSELETIKPVDKRKKSFKHNEIVPLETLSSNVIYLSKQEQALKNSHEIELQPSPKAVCILLHFFRKYN